MLNQIGRRLTERLEAQRGGAGRHRLLLMLDEFPALGRLDFFETALAFMAGYGVRAFLIAQSLNQIEKAYGEHNAILRVQLAQAERRRQPLSCLMLDVDHFKRFNDEFGHDAGDAILRGVGDILSHSIRGDGVAFRYGGEEFLLLMPGLDLAAAQMRAEQIREWISQMKIRHEGKAVGSITCSIGVCAFPDHGAEALVQTADAALLRAKERGRDRTVVAVVRAEGIAA